MCTRWANKISNDYDPTQVSDQIIAQGQALVRVIEGMDVIVPTGWFERWQARLLQAAYKRRLRALVAVAPSCVAEEILSASE
jgi:hypothetical protein